MDEYSNDANLLIWVIALVITGFMFGCGVEADAAAQALQAQAATAVNLDTNMLV
jgi:hypothetical protein